MADSDKPTAPPIVCKLVYPTLEQLEQYWELNRQFAALMRTKEGTMVLFNALATADREALVNLRMWLEYGTEGPNSEIPWDSRELANIVPNRFVGMPEFG
jgi:hypothetical protein